MIQRSCKSNGNAKLFVIHNSEILHEKERTSDAKRFFNKVLTNVPERGKNHTIPVNSSDICV